MHSFRFRSCWRIPTGWHAAVLRLMPPSTRLVALLKASPNGLDDPAFKLLTSAIMEIMRFTSLHATRLATCNFGLRLGDGTTIPIQKGEHMDMTVFPNPDRFVVDRFAQHLYKTRHLPTEGYLFHSLGGGEHLVSTCTCQSLLSC